MVIEKLLAVTVPLIRLFNSSSVVKAECFTRIREIPLLTNA